MRCLLLPHPVIQASGPVTGSDYVALLKIWEEARSDEHDGDRAEYHCRLSAKRPDEAGRSAI